MRSMDSYRRAATERAMKEQEVILRAAAKQITRWQAAEILGISDRHMQRWREPENVRIGRIVTPNLVASWPHSLRPICR
jgi:hypothetical protein